MIEIRAAKYSDVPGVITLAGAFHKRAIGDKWPVDYDRIPDFFHRTIAYPNMTTIVAIENAQIIGMITGAKCPLWWNEAHHIAQHFAVVVHPEHRKKGIGRKLVNALEDWAKLKGCKGVHLSLVAGPDAIDAQAMAVSMGYDLLDLTYSREF